MSPERNTSMVNKLTRTRWLLLIATSIATVSATGSLWFSLGFGLVPCTLCWYQRILMYPLVAILGVAAIEDRISVYKTALPLSVMGVGISAYHSYIQMTAGSCTLSGPCGAIQFQLPIVGLSIPNMAFIAFILTSGLLIMPFLSGLTTISAVGRVMGLDQS